MKNIQSRKSGQKGVTLIEYALIAAIIAVALITNLTAVEAKLASTFTAIVAALP